MGVFLLSCNSRSSEAFVEWVVNLSPMMTWDFWCVFLHDISSLMLCTHAELQQSPYFIMHFKFFNSYVKCVYELQDIGEDLHDSTLQMCIASKSKFLTMHIFRGSSSISCNQIPQYWVLSIHMFIPVENLTYIVINHQKGEIVSASSAP